MVRRYDGRCSQVEESLESDAEGGDHLGYTSTRRTLQECGDCQGPQLMLPLGHDIDLLKVLVSLMCGFDN
jgi:hypothetical protein